MSPDTGNALLACLLGGAVGGIELVGRYRDAPARALRTAPGGSYVAINAVASIAAFLMAESLTWPAGITSPVAKVLLSGLGAMAIFRTAFFTVRSGDQDVGIGPSALLQILLQAVDRAVDRGRAAPRAESVVRIMSNVDFEKAKEGLPAFCMALMQNASAEEQQSLARQIDALASSGMPPAIKSYLLGLAVTGLVGEAVLEKAVAALDSQIR